MIEPLKTLSTLSDLTPEWLLNQLSDMVFVMRCEVGENQFIYEMMNQTAMRMAQLREDAYNMSLQQVLCQKDAEFLHHQYSRAYTSGGPVSFTYTRHGIVGESILSSFVDEDGVCRRIVAVVRDITERTVREQYLQTLAFQDELTGLPNRHALQRQLEMITREGRHSKAQFSVLLIDADGLKRINDTYGHAIGDKYLRELAGRLRTSVQSADALARIGGDEFLIGMVVQDERDAALAAERILENMRTPWVDESITLEMSVSIGIATYPVRTFNLEEVICLADQKLYTAKAKGRRRYEIIPD